MAMVRGGWLAVASVLAACDDATEPYYDFSGASSASAPSLAGAGAVISHSAAGNPSATGGSAGVDAGASASSLPDESGDWTWQACGTVSPPDDGCLDGSVGGLALTEDGRQLLQISGYCVNLWQVDPEFASSTPLWLTSKDMPLAASLAADASIAAASGENGGVFDGRTGELIFERYLSPDFNINAPCVLVQQWASPSGRWVAGHGYEFEVEVYDTETFSEVASLPAGRCNLATAFTRDESLMVTSGPELYRTSDWQRIWPNEIVLEPELGVGSPDQVWTVEYVQFTADEQQVAVTRCDESDGSNWVQCSLRLHDVDTGGSEGSDFWYVEPYLNWPPQPSLSPGGRFILVGGKIVRGDSVTIDPDATAGIFTVEGDIITTRRGGTLTRYCRSRPE